MVNLCAAAHAAVDKGIYVRVPTHGLQLADKKVTQVPKASSAEGPRSSAVWLTYGPVDQQGRKMMTKCWESMGQWH